jgi:hypothetical protein
MCFYTDTQQIRKYSWWHSSGMPKRTYVISDLHYDIVFNDSGKGQPFATRVGLLEYGFDEARMFEFAEFKAIVDAGKILPMNTLPNMLPKNEEKPEPGGAARAQHPVHP